MIRVKDLREATPSKNDEYWKFQSLCTKTSFLEVIAFKKVSWLFKLNVLFDMMHLSCFFSNWTQKKCCSNFCSSHLKKCWSLKPKAILKNLLEETLVWWGVFLPKTNLHIVEICYKEASVLFLVICLITFFKLLLSLIWDDWTYWT